MKDNVELFISASGMVEFLIFQDKFNGLYRYISIQHKAIIDHISKTKKDKEESEKAIRNGPEYYDYGDMYFTKYEMLLSLDFEDGYEAGSGSDLSFFPQYFYSSVITLAISLLESIIAEVIITAESKTGFIYYKSKSRKLEQPYLFKAIDFLNHSGGSYQLPTKIEKEYRKLNDIRNHYIHRLHEENFGRLTDEKIGSYALSYEYVLSALNTISSIARILEVSFYSKK